MTEFPQCAGAGFGISKLQKPPNTTVFPKVAESSYDLTEEATHRETNRSAGQRSSRPFLKIAGRLNLPVGIRLLGVE